jgi:hypothetical protein
LEIERENGLDRWLGLTALIGVVFLAFVGGSFSMYNGTFPADMLRRAFEGGVALYQSLTQYDDPLQTDFWQPARTDKRGVVAYDAARAQNGLTLYSSGHDTRAFLIDMNGTVVHEWSLPYSQVWDKSAAVARPRPDQFIYFEKTHLFPNGDLLALYTANGDTPWGYGLVKMDKNSHVIWKYLAHTHHDFDIDKDGNIYVLTHAISEDDLPENAPKLNKPRIDDFVVKLSPDGHELKRFWLTGAFAKSAFNRRLYFVPWDVYQSRGDYLHANSIQILDRAVPGIPSSRAGQVLVSMRELSTVALADLDSQSVVWALSGFWLRQHDARFLPNGHLMLFDNEGDPSGNGPSRVVELDPANYRLVWSYGEEPGQSLDSIARSSYSRLDNGNTLIVESMAGRAIEVTPKGDIVWEFINPVRDTKAQDKIPIIFWMQRLDSKRDLAPAFRNEISLD